MEKTSKAAIIGGIFTLVAVVLAAFISWIGPDKNTKHLPRDSQDPPTATTSTQSPPIPPLIDVHVSAQASPFNVSFIWQATPWAESGYSYSNYFSYPDGFKITIVTSKQMKSSHIQIHNDNPIKLAPKVYTLSFILSSDKNFLLFSRLGQQDHLMGNSYTDYRLNIVGNGKENEYSIPFTGYTGNNFLYFQFGYAPPDTHIVVKGIKLTIKS